MIYIYIIYHIKLYVDIHFQLLQRDLKEPLTLSCWKSSGSYRQLQPPGSTPHNGFDKASLLQMLQHCGLTWFEVIRTRMSRSDCD